MHSSQPFAASSVQETWSAGAFDSLKLFSLHLTAIGGSGAAARTVVAPLERIKVWHALQRGRHRPRTFLHPCLLQILLQVEGHSNLASRQRYGSFQNAVWQIYQREGFRASTDSKAVALRLDHYSAAIASRLGYLRCSGVLQRQWS